MPYLASVATYFVCVPGFERELAAVGGNLQAFYRRVHALARLRSGQARRLAVRAELMQAEGFHPPRHRDVSARQLGVVRGRCRHVRAALLRATVDAAIQPPIRRERRGQRAVALAAQRRARRGDAVRRSDIGCMGTQERHVGLSARIRAADAAGGDCAGLGRAAGAAHAAWLHLGRPARSRDDVSQRGSALRVHRSRHGAVHRRQRRRRDGRAPRWRRCGRLLRLAHGRGGGGDHRPWLCLGICPVAAALAAFRGPAAQSGRRDSGASQACSPMRACHGCLPRASCCSAHSSPSTTTSAIG